MEMSYDDHEYNDACLESAAKLSEDLKFQLSLTEELGTHYAISEEKNDGVHDENEDEDEEEEEEEEFSFLSGGGNASPIAAEDVFVNGQIKPIFPLFNTDLLLGEKSQVKKVFVEMKTDDDDDDDEDDDSQGTIFTTTTATSTSSANDEISGPYCEWSKQSRAAPEVCKKSNSTGFSKLWRFRDLLHRSNSDGRDAFVFLNTQPTTSSAVKKEEKKGGGEEVKVNDAKVKVKKGGKSKQTKKSLSPHEIYMRSKAKDDDRRRSYLPYRPEVFGFFTNVNGGMSRNVHPF